ARALTTWRVQAHPEPMTGAFVERLFAWVEKAAKPVEIRFREKPSSSMDVADQSAKKSGHFPGPDALPSHYVTPEALRPREQRVAEGLSEAFASAFPSDVLTVRAGAPLAAATSPAPDAPTLVIEYSPEWSHGNTAHAKPNTLFAGLVFTFDASFAAPQSPPWKLTVKTSRSAEAWKFKSQGLPREEFEQKVYDAMIDAMFDQLEKRVDAVFFEGGRAVENVPRPAPAPVRKRPAVPFESMLRRDYRSSR
ncbi:MAG: hypothetical protein FWD17_05270, partial [Polyangiaceae bacterium]|nr:hypothetical protein [Polyangiaceae bacterium]